jgi:hypothetical protein
MSKAADLRRVDRLVVWRLNLDKLSAIALRPIAEALAVDTRCEVQDDIVPGDQRGCGSFETQHRLALQDHWRHRGAESLAGLFVDALVAGEEGWIVVVENGPRQRPQHRRIGVDRPGRQREDRFGNGWFPH